MAYMMQWCKHWFRAIRIAVDSYALCSNESFMTGWHFSQ